MVPKYRERYNSEFSPEKYAELNEKLTESANTKVGFRLSESPIFLTEKSKRKLLDAAESIISQIKKIPTEALQKAVPAKWNVPNDTAQPHFLAIDFGICKNNSGEVVPQLIELQAFPTLYAFQKEYEEVISEIFPFLQDLKNPIPKAEYFSFLKEIIVGNEHTENVILLEIFPEKQKTFVDFALTEKYLGIKTVCLTKIIKKERKLFYESDGREIPINRIYNRVIFDELENFPELKTQFDFREEVDVHWVTHPNWFFKVSKFILPMLEHEFVPKSYFLDEFPVTINPAEYVLKPLFSFAGSGVNLDPTSEIISKIQDKENYIMQKKVAYEPLFEDINGDFAKAEIRLLYLWKENEERPRLMDNLVRMTKVQMANVDFNKKDAIWIGSSIAFFEK